MQSFPVFLPKESHGQGSLVGYSPRGPKELATTEATQHTYMHSSIVCKTAETPPNQ